MGIELRFYRERYNMDDAYYTGLKDIYCILYFSSFDELKAKWDKLISVHGNYLEGETYSAWSDDGKILCGGAFDPGDIDYIKEAYERIGE